MSSTTPDIAWLFLPHTYSKEAVIRFTKLLRENAAKKITTPTMLIAVDGGYEFFRKSRQVADLLIGDFDSLVPFPVKLPSQTLVLPFPRNKSKTDTELAVEYALKSGVQEIHVATPEIGESDQFLGILLMVTSLKLRPKKVQMTIWTPTERITLLRKGECVITGAKGDLVSVVPLSASVQLSWKGTAYDVTNQLVERGEGRGMRNLLTGSRAVLKIQGEAMVIHRDVAPVRQKR